MTSAPLPLPSEDSKFTAGLEMLERTGALALQIRWSDDEEPTVWFAVVQHNVGPDRRPVQRDEPGRLVWECAAATHPTVAVLRLCEQLIDGGMCKHCERPTMFHADLDGQPTPLDPLFCMYEWDPELSTFRRGCE